MRDVVLLLKMLLFHSFGDPSHSPISYRNSSFHSPSLYHIHWCIVGINWSNVYGATLATHLHNPTQCVCVQYRRYVVLFKTHPECLFWIFAASIDERMRIQMRRRNSFGKHKTGKTSFYITLLRAFAGHFFSHVPIYLCWLTNVCLWNEHQHLLKSHITTQWKFPIVYLFICYYIFFQLLSNS